MNTYQLVRTKNDTNGNPRRLWLKYNAETGYLEEILNEDCLPTPGSITICSLDIDTEEYLFLKRKQFVRGSNKEAR